MGLLIAVHFVGAARFLSALSINTQLAKAVAYLASFTFGLYLFHYPLLQLFAAVADRLAIGQRAAFILIATLLATLVACTFTEGRKSDLRRTLQRALDRTLGRAPLPSQKS